MKKIGFIGAHDKTDLLIYTAKVLTSLRNRILIIDSSIMQKAKYVVPAINPTKAYITEFEKIDIAVGFDTMSELKGYLGKTHEEDLEYDIVLLDIDSPKTFNSFEMDTADNNFFVTAFDLYSLRKGLEILSGLEEPINMTKVLYARKILREDNMYLDYLASNTKVRWNQNIIYVMTSEYDNDIIIENQRVAKIKFKSLSGEFKEAIGTIIITILPNIKLSDISKIIKNIDKGV